MLTSVETAERRAVLVVEDHADLLTAVLELLRDEGFDSVGASSLDEARALLAARRVACVVVDFVLADGFADALIDDIVRASQPVPVVLFSVQPETRAVAEHYRIPFVKKPYDTERLLATIETALTGAAGPVVPAGPKPVFPTGQWTPVQRR